MERRVKQRMIPTHPSSPPDLLSLPDAALLEILRHLDGQSLANLQATTKYFHAKEPITGLPLAEHIARENVLRICRTRSESERFRRRSWSERLFLENDASCGFDRQHNESAEYRFTFSPDGKYLRTVRLSGMGPKLLVSDATTGSQPFLRWQLRVRGNTAVEFGVIPAALEPSHTALHKCLSVPTRPQERSVGFCSQITAGSLLSLKAPVLRGTLLDILVCKGHMEVILRYPEDAKEITWHNGQPVHKPYRGPRELRLEQDFSPDYDVRLALTSWAKGSFDVLHQGFDFDPAWAQDCLRAEAEMRAEAAAAAEATAAAEHAPAILAAEHPAAGEAAPGMGAAPPQPLGGNAGLADPLDPEHPEPAGPASASQQAVAHGLPACQHPTAQPPSAAAAASDATVASLEDAELGWEVGTPTAGTVHQQGPPPGVAEPGEAAELSRGGELHGHTLPAGGKEGTPRVEQLEAQLESVAAHGEAQGGAHPAAAECEGQVERLSGCRQPGSEALAQQHDQGEE